MTYQDMIWILTRKEEEKDILQWVSKKDLAKLVRRSAYILSKKK